MTDARDTPEAVRRKYLDKQGRMAAVYAVIGGGEGFEWERRWVAKLDTAAAEIARLRSLLRGHAAAWHTREGHEGHIDDCHWSTCERIRDGLAPQETSE